MTPGTASPPAAAAGAAGEAVQRPRWNQIEGLRAIAATSVFMWHVWLVLVKDLDRTIEEIGRNAFSVIAPLFEHSGSTGVSLFYAISGFLLYQPFVRARAEGRNLFVRWYLVRRAARIIPAYWAALIIIGLVTGNSQVFTVKGFFDYFLFMELFTPLDIAQITDPLMDDPLNLRMHDAFVTLTGNPIGVAWTLCVEVTFYLFLPVWAWAMEKLTRARRSPVRIELLVLAALMMMSLAFKAVVLARLAEVRFEPWTMILPNSIDIFAVGMILALLAQRSLTKGWPRPLAAAGRRPGVSWGLGVAVFLVLCAAETAWVHTSGGFWPLNVGYKELQNRLMGLWAEGNLVIAALFLTPAVVGSRRATRIGRFLTSRVMAWIGLVSYGLYLWHIFVLEEVAKLFTGDVPPIWAVLPVAAVCYLLALAVAAISWYVLERRALRPARRLPLLQPRRDEPAPGS